MRWFFFLWRRFSLLTLSLTCQVLRPYQGKTAIAIISSATMTTVEVCAEMVKGARVYPKNAAQHAADLAKLEKEPAVNSVFINPLTDRPKEIECIRVDSATDEGPGHHQIQFWWTLRHMQRPAIFTLVTTRSSGASYLNRVELQNGCLALGHANVFIQEPIYF